jgi:dsRNA-specific ribonuclease
LDEILENNLTKDYKTIFQEFAQAKFDITPHYNIIDEK